MFISILDDAYHVVKDATSNEKNEYEVIEYITAHVKRKFILFISIQFSIQFRGEYYDFLQFSI